MSPVAKTDSVIYLSEDKERIGVVLQPLTHLLAITVTYYEKPTHAHLVQYLARTRPLTMRFFHGADPKRAVPMTRRV